MNTLFTGQTLIQLNKVESTNKFASELLADSEVLEGTVINAVEQTSGRGQRGNSWISEPGKNLTLSIILKPSFLPAIMQFQLNKALSLAVRDFFLKFNINDVTVKWPNDIYINGNKASGILIENQLKNARITCSIAGIGININQEQFLGNFNAISLKEITGMEYNLQDCLAILCESVEKRYLQLRAGHNLDDEYLQHLYRYNIPSDFLVGELLMKGKITGISPEGKLIIEHGGGVLKKYDLKEISFYP